MATNYKTCKYYIPIQNPTDNNTHVQISIYYTQGGMSFYDYKNVSQGIKLSVDKIEIKENCIRSTMGTSVCFNLLETKRYNEKKLKEVADKFKANKNQIAEMYNNGTINDIQILVNETMKGV